MNELRHLFVFKVCGRLMSFTQAAVELGVSQPAVSLAIRQLEVVAALIRSRLLVPVMPQSWITDEEFHLI
ncbi:MAG: LysR family transcriptional regulator [Gammaproteobacteria bacterium]|nr:LysR family transcriptional regulator [Gammaproteobacteria bacterium]